MSVDDLVRFLMSARDFTEEECAQIRSEKIDSTTVMSMSEEELQSYIPALGDRVALRKFCQTQLNEPNEDMSKFASSLLARIKRKTSLDNEPDIRRQKLVGNTNAFRDERRFEVGWMNYDGREYRQIREKRGGGTRHLKATKDTPLKNIKQTAIDLFFPGGKSQLGNIEDFDVILRDIAEDIVDENITLIEQYDKRKLKMLRLYIATKRRCNTVSQCEDELPDLDTVCKKTKTVAPKPRGTISRRKSVTCTIVSEPNEPVTEMASTAGDKTQETQFRSGKPGTSARNVLTERTNALQVEPLSTTTEETKTVGVPVELESPIPQPSTSAELDFLEIAIAESLSEDYLINLSDNEVMFAPMVGNSVLEDTLPLEEKAGVVKMRLHRGQVFSELNDAVKNGKINTDTEIIEVEMVLPNGTTEKGEDNGGVFRDALSEYFDTFYVKCTVGNSVRVPSPRHDMREIWEYVATIMVVGKKIANYFPVAIALPFLNYCIGIESDGKDLVAAFEYFIPSAEREILNKAKTNFSDIAKDEDFRDFLESHEVKVVVQEDTWDDVLYDIAHLEMIQESAFIANRWRGILRRMHLPDGGFRELIGDLVLSSKKVLSMLRFLDEDSDKPSARFLKKFIRNLPSDRLSKFVRFCTGADIMVCPVLHIRLVEPLNAFARCPVAHTCGCVLEVPNNYTTYMELAEEFTALLDSNVWVMDLI